VLGGWVELIRTGTATKLDIEQLLDLPYQLIHRAAAAAFNAEAVRWLSKCSAPNLIIT
jgi:hypothetical protein